MKKTSFALIIKILSLGVFIYFLVHAILKLPSNFSNIKTSNELLSISPENENIYNEILQINLKDTIFIFVSLIFSFCVLLISNIKSLQFIKESLIEKIAKKKKENAPIRKEKALQKKQEQLQALQDEIKQMKNGE